MLWAPRFMANAPAAAPLRKTNVNTTAHATLGSQPRPAMGAFRISVLIGRQRDQHVIASWSGFEHRRFLLSHHQVRRRSAGIIGLESYQIAAQYGQRQQRGECQPPSKAQVE